MWNWRPTPRTQPAKLPNPHTRKKHACDHLGLTSGTSCGDPRRNFKLLPSSSGTSTSNFDMTIPAFERRRRGRRHPNRYIYTDRHANRQAGKPTDTQTERQTNRQTRKQTCRQTDRQTDKHANRHRNRHTCSQTGKHRYKDRHTDRK